MVLHLLGKKSWNVYNNENVERVRRDEAEAKAREEAEELRLQEEDAERRLATLRGEKLPPLPLSAVDELGKSEERQRRRDDGLPRKRRRLRDEDDTDRDIRYAREDAEAGEKAKQTLVKPSKDQEAPLLDHAGHLQLIPAPDEKAIRKAEKNAEVEAEKAKKRKREEDQYTMRFSNAAGFNNNMGRPWYAASKTTASETTSHALVLADVQDKDVWGNEDPLRRDRERSRISSNDPFAAMQQAQMKIKQSEYDRNKWNRDREAELEELKQAEERRRRKKHRRRDDDDDGHSLDDFSLDAPSADMGEQGERDRRRRRHHHHRRGSRSRSRERDRKSRHHSSKGREVRKV